MEAELGEEGIGEWLARRRGTTEAELGSSNGDGGASEHRAEAIERERRRERAQMVVKSEVSTVVSLLVSTGLRSGRRDSRTPATRRARSAWVGHGGEGRPRGRGRREGVRARARPASPVGPKARRRPAGPLSRFSFLFF